MKRPIERFLELESASGILLLVATAAALLWANSPWAASYEQLWRTPIRASAGGQTIEVTVHFVVSDVLMAVFFFAVGLEIRRELRSGELSDARRAALPVLAALGGMVVPAAIYLAFNRDELARGWGIPMATDIAFAVGVLALLGSRVTPSMRVFLLALAIIDDIGAIVVIAIFYSSGLQLDGIALALSGVAAIVAMQRFGVRRAWLYVLPAGAIWLGTYRAGIHPTIAGVIVGLLTPAASRPGEPLAPVDRLERAFHPWVAFAIMPLFAFSNAGIELGGVHAAATPMLVVGIAAGLLIGKPLGIVVASALAVRLRIASLPRGLTWRGVAVVGAVAGIGFTMALFISELAFAERQDLQGTAKLVVLLTSATAAAASWLLGWRLLRREPASRPVPATAAPSRTSPGSPSRAGRTRPDPSRARTPWRARARPGPDRRRPRSPS
ncbi:MAG: Na+/H+ antiporter NhaA [Acidobacteriota bacterium]